MSAIQQIVQVVISQETSAVPQPSFSIPLIMGPSDRFVDLVRYYTSPSGYITDGGLITDPEFIYLSEAFEQALRPSQVGVGKFTASVAQVDTFAVNTIVSSHVYEFTLNGTLISYTAGGSETQQSILTALLAAIATAFPTNPPVTGAVTGTGSGALLTLTSSVPGVAVVYTAVDSDLTHVAVTASHSIVSDIIALQAVSDIWYGLAITSHLASDIEQVANYIETQFKIFIASSSDAGILTSGSTDVASILKAASYKRTALLYSGIPADGPEAAWLGGQLPQVPGASTWKFKTLVGIAPDTFTPTQRTNVIGLPGIPGKNANIYETVGGVPITEEGTMAGGQFIDLTVGIDWLQSTMQTNIYQLLVNAPKIPYTNKGISIIETAVRQTLDQGVANGLIDGTEPITITVPDVLSISDTDRAERLLPNVNFQCRLAGALHFVQVNGVVTV